MINTATAALGSRHRRERPGETRADNAMTVGNARFLAAGCVRSARMGVYVNDAGGRQIAWRRYERKYLISEADAAEVTRFCHRYLEPDAFLARQCRRFYPILSIYFDSPQHDLLRHALEKRLHRLKLRVRTYCPCGLGFGGERPAFLEIKRKDNGVSQKFRACVTTGQLADLIWPRPLADRWLPALPPEHREHAEQFLLLREAFRARPAIGISYEREAYETHGGGDVRITLDRRIQFCALPPDAVELGHWWPALSSPQVVLEVKFTHSCPFWLASMLRRMGIVNRGISKYVLCSRLAERFLGPDRFVRVV